MSTDTDNFISILQAAFQARCRSNPRYSIRAFARFLGMDFSVLAKLLRGERRAGKKLIQQLGPRLGLSRHEVEKLVGTVKPIERKKRSYRKIGIDEFSPLADWHYLTMLELSHLPHFEPDARWIAQALGISVTKARMGIETLCRHGFLRIASDGTWHDMSGRHMSLLVKERTNELLQTYQEKMLVKAIEGLRNTPPPMRDHTTLTFAISKDKLATAKEKITRFRRELDAFLSDGNACDEVYSLNICLFPLSQTMAGPFDIGVSD